MTIPETSLQLWQVQPPDLFSLCPPCTFYYYNERGKPEKQERLLPPLDAEYEALRLGYETFRSNSVISGVEYVTIFPPPQRDIKRALAIADLQKELFHPRKTIYFGTILQEKDLPAYHPSIVNEELFVSATTNWLCRTRSGHFYYLTENDDVVMARQIEIYDRHSGHSHVRPADSYEGYIIYQQGQIFLSGGIRTRLVDKIIQDRAQKEEPLL